MNHDDGSCESSGLVAGLCLGLAGLTIMLGVLWSWSPFLAIVSGALVVLYLVRCLRSVNWGCLYETPLKQESSALRQGDGDRDYP